MNIKIQSICTYSIQIGRYFRGQVESLIQYDVQYGDDEGKINCPYSVATNHWKVWDATDHVMMPDPTLKITCEGI